MEKKFQRIPFEGALAGVCAGIAEYLAIDKVWIRLFFVLSVIFSSAFGIGFLGPVVYIVLWIVLPVKSAFPHVDNRVSDYDSKDSVQENEIVPNMEEPSLYFDEKFDKKWRKAQNKNYERKTSGIILVLIGLVFLFLQFDLVEWRELRKFWPVVLILIGLLVVFRSYTSLPRFVEKPEDEVINSELNDEKTN